MGIDDTSPASRRAASVVFRDGCFAAAERVVPDEVAIAISVNGSTHAVMMATPRDVEELGIGLALNERIVANRSEIERIEIEEGALGTECRLWIDAARASAYAVRRRQMTGPVGCGLCGIESLELAARDLPVVDTVLEVSPRAIGEAVEAMSRRQTLGQATRAVHAAGFWQPGEGLLIVREDVGRHNALDKVTGYLALNDRDPGRGLIAMTSRVSVELIQKAAAMGVPLIAAVSAPTSLAISEAQASGITLVAVVRGGDFEIFTHPHRISGALDAGGDTSADASDCGPEEETSHAA